MTRPVTTTDLPALGLNPLIGGMVTQVTENWIVVIVPMLFNHRIILCTHSEWRYGWTAGWCYPSSLAAVAAEGVFNPEEQLAPVGYIKIAGDGRVTLWYCPKCGKPSYEPTEDCHDF